ncbi:MAG: response regulator [Magnetococcales bacterium]|nr:response regulator [Magnetococcales bacterium]
MGRSNMANILIIDDDQKECLSLRQLLEEKGHSISEANNKELGLEIIHNNKIDYLFFNINMPDVNGFGFLTELPESLVSKSIILTPEGSIAPLEFVMQLANCKGTVGALKKPVKLEPLLKLMEHSLTA